MREKYQTEIEKRISEFESDYAFTAVNFVDIADTDPANKALSRLSEHGMPVANGYVFSATSTDPGAKMETDVQIGILEENIEKVKDIVMFASPYITG